MHRPKVLNLGGSWSKASSSTVHSLGDSRSTPNDTFIHSADIWVGGCYYVPSNVLGMENTQANKLDQVPVAEQIFHLFPYISQPPSSWADNVKGSRRDAHHLGLSPRFPCSHLILQSFSSPTAASKEPWCSRWCSHKALKPPMTWIPE